MLVLSNPPVLEICNQFSIANPKHNQFKILASISKGRLSARLGYFARFRSLCRQSLSLHLFVSHLFFFICLSFLFTAHLLGILYPLHPLTPLSATPLSFALSFCFAPLFRAFLVPPLAPLSPKSSYIPRKPPLLVCEGRPLHISCVTSCLCVCVCRGNQETCQNYRVRVMLCC